MLFSTGFKYRLGVRIKDFGERICHINILGWFSSPIIAKGLQIKNSVLDSPVIRKVEKMPLTSGGQRVPSVSPVRVTGSLLVQARSKTRYFARYRKLR